MFIFIERNPKKVLAITALFFALIYSILAFKAGLVFNSPDENANYFFSNLLATENRLDYPLTVDSDIIHPRSMTVVDSSIVPQSFLGMPILYGILGKIFNSQAIIFFTPVIATVSVLFFYEIIKRTFGAKNAFLSSLLVFIHPAFWYYSTHSMYHNILFVSLLITGVYFLINNNPEEKVIKYKNLILGSIFIGLALMVRSCEAFWVLLILIVLCFLNRNKISFRKIIICLFVFFILSLPIFFLNNQLYGHPLLIGYNLAGNPASGVINTSILNSLIKTFIKSLINIFRNFWNYAIYIFWWLSIPSYFGIFWLLKNYKKLKNKQKQYLIIFSVGLAYLVIYYGRWIIQDNPDPTKITIGTSYVRYWLPIYIFSMPFLATLLLKIKKSIIKISNIQKIVLLCILAIFINYNFLFVFKLTNESIGRNVLEEYKKIREKVLNLTEDNAIIVAGYYDKLFFPYRFVIENFDEERDKRLKEIKKLLEVNYPIYYYSWNNDTDIEYLNGIFGKYGLKLMNSQNIRKRERLFEIVQIEQKSEFNQN